ncbi:hypothetical protein JHK85_018688 [Glycine max]|nr:hypothetical protein JHK85_018688 [Glycine max]
MKAWCLRGAWCEGDVSDQIVALSICSDEQMKMMTLTSSVKHSLSVSRSLMMNLKSSFIIKHLVQILVNHISTKEDVAAATPQVTPQPPPEPSISVLDMSFAQTEPSAPVSASPGNSFASCLFRFAQLSKLGVLSWKLDADNHGNDPEMKKIHEEHGDTYMDHNDAWIREWVKKGGMIILPVRIYHHFTLDESNYIKLFPFLCEGVRYPKIRMKCIERARLLCLGVSHKAFHNVPFKDDLKLIGRHAHDLTQLSSASAFLLLVDLSLAQQVRLAQPHQNDTQA